MMKDLGFPATDEVDYVYLGYNREEAERVSVVAQKLRYAGLSIWYDSRIVPGDQVKTVLAERIKDSTAVLMMLTLDAFLKGESLVQQEFEVAFDIYHKPIIVVLFDKIQDNQISIDKIFWWNQIKKIEIIEYFNGMSMDLLCEKILKSINRYDDSWHAHGNYVGEQDIFGMHFVQNRSKNDGSRESAKKEPNIWRRHISIWLCLSILAIAGCLPFLWNRRIIPSREKTLSEAQSSAQREADSLETQNADTQNEAAQNKDSQSNDDRYKTILKEYRDVITDEVSIEDTVLYCSSPEVKEFQELLLNPDVELPENGIENDGRWWQSWLQYVTTYGDETGKYRQAPLAAPLEDYIFSYYDLNQDGKDELIMAQASSSDEQELYDVGMICDIWAEEDGKYMLLAASEDQYTYINITESHVVYEDLASRIDEFDEYHGIEHSVWCDGVSVFRYTDSGPMVVDYSLLDYAISDGSELHYEPFVYYYIADYYCQAYAHYYKGDQAVGLSKDEYDAYLNALKPMDYTKLDWNWLSDLSDDSKSISNQITYTGHENIFADLPIFEVYNQGGGYGRTIVFNEDGTMCEKYSDESGSYPDIIRHFSIKEKVNERFYILTDDDHKGSILGRELGTDPFYDDFQTLLLYLPGSKIPALEDSSQSQEYIQSGLNYLIYGLFYDNECNQSMYDPLQNYVIWWDGNIFVGE